jgi:hypothetical protein
VYTSREGVQETTPVVYMKPFVEGGGGSQIRFATPENPESPAHKAGGLGFSLEMR